MSGFKVYLDEEKAEKIVQSARGGKAGFLCVIGSTETAKIPGISAAGKFPELTDYTPAADVEFVELGKCLSLDAIPVTPEGIPTPAIITRAALKLTGIPFFVADAGVAVKPKIPHFSIGAKKGGNIAEGKGAEEPERIYENAKLLGRKLANVFDFLLVGESIPGGTTTTLGTLTALGYEADGKVSSSMPSNPHNLKVQVVESGLSKVGAKRGDFSGKPFEAVKFLGDPVHIAMAGVAEGFTSVGKLLALAGGTQMTAVLSLLAELSPQTFDKIAVWTTRWVAEDKTSDLLGLVKQISERKGINPPPVFAVQLDFSKSEFEGLRAYEQGVVKEGVGAGGTALYAVLSGYSPEKLFEEIEKIYREIVSQKSD